MWGAIAAAAAPVLGNILLQRDTNETNKEIAGRQIDFQREMSNTAHQREVNDLMAAGLNPTLSAGGNGSSTPTGASAEMKAPTISLPDMFAYGISMKQLDQAEQRLKMDQANSAAGIAKTMSETELNKMKKILNQKGIIRAEAEGQGYQMLMNAIKKLKGMQFRPSPNVPGGEMNDTVVPNRMP